MYVYGVISFSQRIFSDLYIEDVNNFKKIDLYIYIFDGLSPFNLILLGDA